METENRLGALKYVGLFIALYLLSSALFTWYTQNWEFLFYVAVVVVLAYCGFLVHVRVGLSRGLLWALAIWGLLHMIGGLVPVPDGWPIDGDKSVFYSLWIIPNYVKYDHIVHAFGFGCTTVLCWQAIQDRLHPPAPTRGILLLCVLAGMGLGAFNEIIEFIAVLLIPDTNVGGYVNTGWDLVSNLVGCALAAWWIRYSSSQGLRT